MADGSVHTQTAARSGATAGRRVAQVVEFMTEDLSATIEAGKEELKESGTQFQSVTFALHVLLVQIVPFCIRKLTRS